MTGLDLVELCADLTTFVPGRRLDDNAQVMMRYAGGARGVLWASQVASGNENEIRLRVYGTRGGLDWSQREANQLIWSPLGGTRQIITRNGAGADAANRRSSRVPGGHPEGYLEAFANIYVEAAAAIRAARDGLPFRPTSCPDRRGRREGPRLHRRRRPFVPIGSVDVLAMVLRKEATAHRILRFRPNRRSTTVRFGRERARKQPDRCPP